MLDTHCHIQFSAYKDDADEVIKRCVEKNVILNAVGSQRDTSARAVEYAGKYDNIYATVGLHPIHLFKSRVDEAEAKFESREEEFDYEYYKKLAKNKKVIAIGECGLDFFHLPKGVGGEEVLKKQKEIFLAQYNLAKELGLPLVIHVREAHEEMIGLLRYLVIPSEQSDEESLSKNTTDRNPSHAFGMTKSTIRGVIHCYTSNWEIAEQYLDLGLYLGFTGVITFPPKKTDPQTQLDLLEVVEKCPLERMLVETDAPYLAPQAYRGQRCEPWMVEEVAKKIAEIKGVPEEAVLNKTTENAKKLFKIS
ncbi:MAG: TatD family hydrolase [Patescibacteria group bacterium]